MQVPSRLDGDGVGTALDGEGGARVGGQVLDEALALEVVSRDELGLLEEGAEDHVRRDERRPAPAEELFQQAPVVVGVDVRQEYIRNVHRRHADPPQIRQGLRRGVDEEALAVDPDDEARQVAERIESMAGAERRDAESRPRGGELERPAQRRRNVRLLAGGRGHLHRGLRPRRENRT